MVERISCNGGCPWVETIVRIQDEYEEALEGLNSVLDLRLPPDMEDRIFERSLEKIGETEKVLGRLPKKCQKCFWAGIDTEDSE